MALVVILFVALATFCDMCQGQGADSTSGSSFVTEPAEFIILAGESVTLPCLFAGPDTPAMALWNKDGVVIAMGSQVFGDAKDRITVLNNGLENTLILSNTEVADEGMYECTAPGENNPLVHQVTVNLPPTLTMDPDQEETEVELGNTLTLTCTATGKPEPTITWAKVDENLPSGDTTYEGEVLDLGPVEREFAGTYRCTAENGAGNPVVEFTEIFVRYAPIVSTTQDIVHTGPGHLITIECRFDASPEADVVWYQEGELIDWKNRDNFHYSIDGQTSQVTINPVRDTDMGLYTCDGGNTFGSASEDIFLSALPYRLRITSNNFGAYSNLYRLTWQVGSIAPLQYYTIKYMQLSTNSSEEWQEVQIDLVPDSKEIHEGSYTFTDLQPNDTFLVQVLAVNSFGASNWTDVFQFQTNFEHKTPSPPELETEGKTSSIEEGNFPVDGASSLLGAVNLVLLLLCILMLA